MDVDKTGHWLNLLANLAVLVGIVFLAIEVRHAGNSSRMQMQDAVATGFNDLTIAIATDPLFSRVVAIGLHEPQRLTDAELVQFGMFMRAYLNQQYRMYAMRQLNLLSDEEWRLLVEELGSMLGTPGGALYMRTNQDMPVELAAAVEPFLGQAPKWDILLGRDASGLE